MSQTVFLVSTDTGLLRHWRQAAGEYEVQEAALDWPDVCDAIVLLDADMKSVPVWQDAWWRQRTASMRIVVLSTRPSEDQGFAALVAGCSAYCHALSSQEQLKQVLAVVEAGEIWAGRALVQRLLSVVNKLPFAVVKTDLLAGLSEREREVARLAASGAANKVIARELGITERTVKAHLSSAFEKLHLTDRVQLALLVHGIR